jgi:hypothetical protein
MIRQFEKLTPEEYHLLLQAPVLVSVLACCSPNEVNKAQKADAIKLAHFKTFTAKPLLLPYYHEVEKQFKHHFEEAIKKFHPLDADKKHALKDQLRKVDRTIGKLDREYGDLLRRSLENYSKHVKKADHSVFMDFIFPLPIHGLND